MFRKSIISFNTLVLSVLIFIAGLSFADQSNQGTTAWSVVAITGEVKAKSASFSTTDKLVALEISDTLLAPITMETGDDSRITLSRLGDTISIAPNSVVHIPKKDIENQHLHTKIIQRIGNVFYRVKKKQKPAFEVHTPLLVTVVKGTAFNVEVNEEDVVVSLVEGSLLINSLDEDDVDVHLLPGPLVLVRREESSPVRATGFRPLSGAWDSWTSFLQGLAPLAGH